MPRLLTALFLSAAVSTSAFAADVPSYVGKRVSTPADIAAIEKVTEDFRAAIRKKDTLLLSSLLLDSHILFASPMPPAAIKNISEKIDAHFDGLPGGAAQFLEFIMREKGEVDERFYNIKITQDGHAAFVMFDYDFSINGKVSNYGVEQWQMMKSKEGKWKIVSVFWTNNPAPR
jgi:ketosteroid isomerase-like protein